MLNHRLGTGIHTKILDGKLFLINMNIKLVMYLLLCVLRCSNEIKKAESLSTFRNQLEKIADAELKKRHSR